MLFKTIAEIKTYIPTVNKNMAWVTFSPAVDQAERKYLLPILGKTQFDNLTAAYQAGTMSAHQAALLPYVQRPLAFFAFYEILPYLTASVGDLGIQEQQSSENTAIPARQFIINDLRETAAQSADTFIDDLLEFLETNQANYPDWKNSTAYTITKELFLNSLAEFETHVPIAGSRRVWLVFRPFVKLAEVEYILPAISQKLYDDLKAKILLTPATPLSAAYATLLSKIQRTLAWLAVYKALPFTIIAWNPGGITLSNTGDGIVLKTTADRLRYETAKTEATNTAMSFLRELKKYLDDNTASFQLYEFSDTENSTQPQYTIPDNSVARSFMV